MSAEETSATTPQEAAPSEEVVPETTASDATPPASTESDLTPAQVEDLMKLRILELEATAKAPATQTKLEVNADGYVEQTIIAPSAEDEVVEFNAADKFDGSRPGFVFRMGPKGLGYYGDSFGKLMKSLYKMEAAHAPEEAKKRREEAAMALMEPMPDPSLKEPEGEKLEVEFKAAKWGIAARMSGGPVVLTKVKAGGEGESLGLKIGDIIVEINGVSVTHRRSTALVLVRAGGEAKVRFARPSANDQAAAAAGGPAGSGSVVDATKAVSGEVPQSVRELQAMIGGAKAKDTVTVAGEKGVTKTLEDGSFDSNSTLVFYNCEDCNYIVESYALKVYLQGCKNVNVTFNAKILTATLETFKCDDLTLAINTKVGTLQADICDGIDITYAKKEDFHMCIWAGCEKLKVSFEDSGESFASGFKEMAEARANVNKERSQFKVSVVGGKLKQEPVVRLANGFTTTAREKKAFEDTQEMNLQAMAKTMGITIKPGKKGIKVKPNQPCPCGSGIKVKKCCPADMNGYWKPLEKK